MEGIKRCSKCGEWRTLDQFYRDRGKKDGLYSWCKPCHCVDTRARHLADPLRLLWHNAKLSTNTRRSRGRAEQTFELTLQDLHDIYDRQASKCFWSGLPIYRDSTPDNPLFRTSLDRLDPNVGYTVENTVLSCQAMNFMRSDSTYETTLRLLQQLGLKDGQCFTDDRRRVEPVIIPPKQVEISEPLTGEPLKRCAKCHLSRPLSCFYRHPQTKDRLDHRCRDCHDMARRQHYYDNPLMRLVNSARASTKTRNARGRGHDFDLTVHDLLEHWEESDRRCYWLGIDLDVTQRHPEKIFNVSIDRIDPTLGYTKDNVVLCSMAGNYLRTRATLEETIEFLKAIGVKDAPCMADDDLASQ